MPRIDPLMNDDLEAPVLKAFEQHVQEFNSRITNMKATLGHSLLAFDVYMQWYPLYKEVEKILGTRLGYLYAYSISHASNCPLCATFFRKIIIEAGESPEQLELSEQEQHVLNFGGAIADHKGHIADHLYRGVAQYYSHQALVVLIAFAGQMVATNIFNNVVETDIDEYLKEYIPVFLKSCL
jgi:hypothetical protein